MYEGKPNVEILTLDALENIYDMTNGLLNEKVGTIFVANIIKNNATWIEEANITWETKVVPMYDTLRYTIETAWMDGIYREKIPMKDWQDGF